jgi:hypothetical protein
MREVHRSDSGPDEIYVQREVVSASPAGSDYVVRRESAVPAAQVVPAVAERRVITRRRFDPAAVVTVVAGIVLAVIGAVAVARAGLTGPIDEPVVDVAGASHTALLGLIELGMGLVLVWAGLTTDRAVILFCSILFGAAALVAAIEPNIGDGALAIERSWAVVLVVGFGVIAAVAALAASIYRSTDRIERV